MRVWWFLALGIAAVAAWGQQLSFVACPMVRDTRTSPCFLVEYQGETYFLDPSARGYRAPQLKHRVLVEGSVEPGARVCGGIPLKPVSISVLKEIDPACNTLLPSEPGIEGLAVAVPPATAERPDFILLYPFDEDAVDAAGAEYLARLASSLKSGVKVTGYRATSLLSSGQRMVEKEGIAQKRAEKVAALLRGLGVKNVTAGWKAEAEPGDGKDDASRRRVVISIVTP